MAPVSAAGMAASCSSREPRGPAWQVPHCSGQVQAGCHRPAGQGYLQLISNMAWTFLPPGFAGPQTSCFLVNFFAKIFYRSEATFPKPHRHHPCLADPGVSPAGLTCRTGMWMPNTILPLNSCRFAALWHFQSEQGSRVHHVALIKISLHLHGTWVSPKRRRKQRKGTFPFSP